MTPRPKLSLGLIRLEMDQRREKQNHIPALIHDGRMAERATHFARQLVLDGFGARVVPFEVVVARDEVDVFFVEYGGPLEGRGYPPIPSAPS